MVYASYYILEVWKSIEQNQVGNVNGEDSKNGHWNVLGTLSSRSRKMYGLNSKTSSCDERRTNRKNPIFQFVQSDRKECVVFEVRVLSVFSIKFNSMFFSKHTVKSEFVIFCLE